MQYKTTDLFGNEDIRIISKDRVNSKTLFTDYDGFVDKFEVKKTTDDCYTPESVYRRIIDFVNRNFDLSEYNIVRPFYPGSDYENIQYGKQDIVIDNPPFSIVSKIASFYLSKGIKFFLFAPHLTLFSSDLDCSCIVCGASIIYENGANVKTSFLSNVFGDVKVMGVPDLYEKLEEINKNNNPLPKYKYPINLLTVSAVQKLVERGVSLVVSKFDTKHVRKLDCQHKHGKAIFGSGFLISENSAADRAAAEKIIEPNIIYWELSNKEIEIIKQISLKPNT